MLYHYVGETKNNRIARCKYLLNFEVSARKEHQTDVAAMIQAYLLHYKPTYLTLIERRRRRRKKKKKEKKKKIKKKKGRKEGGKKKERRRKMMMKEKRGNKVGEEYDEKLIKKKE